MRLLWSAVIAVVLASVLWMWLPGDAHAQPNAQAVFLEARKLYDAGNCEAALPLFREAERASQSPNAKLFVARCLQRLGRLPEAYEQMRHTVDVATEAATTDAKYIPTQDAAATELAVLQKKIGRIAVALVDPVPGTRVQVGERELPPDMWSDPVAVPPGQITVTKLTPGQPDATSVVDVAAGQLRTVGFRDPVAAAAPPDESGGLSPVQGAGIAVALVGHAALVTSAVTFAMAESLFADLEQACGPQPTCVQPPSQEDIDRGNALDAATVATVIGGAALSVAGVLMMALGGEADTTEVDAGAWIAPTTAGATVRFRF